MDEITAKHTICFCKIQNQLGLQGMGVPTDRMRGNKSGRRERRGPSREVAYSSGKHLSYTSRQLNSMLRLRSTSSVWIFKNNLSSTFCCVTKADGYRAASHPGRQFLDQGVTCQNIRWTYLFFHGLNYHMWIPSSYGYLNKKDSTFWSKQTETANMHKELHTCHVILRPLLVKVFFNLLPSFCVSGQGYKLLKIHKQHLFVRMISCCNNK